MPDNLQLPIFPEVPGERVWRPEVHRSPTKKLSQDEIERGPKCELPDGIHILTVSANTPAELFDAAQGLNMVSPTALRNHNDGFLPSGNYDSAIAVVRGRVIGGLIADRGRVVTGRPRLGGRPGPSPITPGLRPVVLNVWVHKAHRHKGVERRLLEGAASHFSVEVGSLALRPYMRRRGAF